ncbi:MAG: 4-(cytidine 5'-diphospho)-2-C-methyl-D-erythritol kinase [Pirellulaceae bacterium]
MSNILRRSSPAKINLFLEILRKRPDGYHELETIMTRVDLCDEMEFQITDSPAISIQTVCDDESDKRLLPNSEQNVIFRVLEDLRQTAGLEMGMRVSLRKRIPIQAGLGGASSNAATALLAANEIWNLQWSPERLNEVAARHGSDISFFLFPGIALCRGRGELVTPVNHPVGNFVVIVKPPEGFSTKEIFSRFCPPSSPRSAQAYLQKVAEKHEIPAAEMFNRFSEIVCELSETQIEIKAQLIKNGAISAQVSGSGSAWFGLFPTMRSAEEAAKAILASNPDFRAFVAKTIP